MRPPSRGAGQLGGLVDQRPFSKRGPLLPRPETAKRYAIGRLPNEAAPRREAALLAISVSYREHGAATVWLTVAVFGATIPRHPK